MTKQEIRAYLEYENVGHSADSQITRVIFKADKTQLSHFLKASQMDHLMANNQWIFNFFDSPQGISTINGDDIEALKVGAKPFN